MGLGGRPRTRGLAHARQAQEKKIAELDSAASIAFVERIMEEQRMAELRRELVEDQQRQLREQTALFRAVDAASAAMQSLPSEREIAAPTEAELEAMLE